MSSKQKRIRLPINYLKSTTYRDAQSVYAPNHKIRNIIAMSNNEMTTRHVRNNSESSTNTIPVKLANEKKEKYGLENIKQVLVDEMKLIRNSIEKFVENSKRMEYSLEKLTVQSTNKYKIRHQQIDFNIKNYPDWRIFIGKVFDQVCQRSFQMFINQQLSYQEMKSFCSQKILLNLMTFWTKETELVDSIPCVEWEREIIKIIDYQCNKYPQTQKIQINKKLQQIVNRTKINNFDNEDYDLIDKTQVKFTYKSINDYTQEIMKFLNQIITITQKRVDQGKNLYSNFQIFFTNVFNLVHHKNVDEDLVVLHQERLTDYQFCKHKFEEDDDIEYSEKVKSYTKFDIGCKIPLNSQIFSHEEMHSGIINIKNKAVARFIDKWIDQLKDKLFDSQKSVMEKISRFKGENPGDRIKLSQKEKEILVQCMNVEKENVKNFQLNINKNMEDIADMLKNSLGSYAELTFLSEEERNMGEFACKMQQASVEYSIQKLNFLIGSLLRAAQKAKSQINKTKPVGFIGDEVAVNILSCKIGDLMRCRFYSREQQVLRVFQFLKAMSESNYKNLFKIVRIKNRLGQSTRDILINAYFKNEIVCQIQLAINQTNKKQRFMDKFNHFLYELKRSQMGTLIQLCTIWVQNSPKSIAYKKSIEKQNQYKIKNRQTVCSNAIFQFQNGQYQVVKFPFICRICKIFYATQKTIFSNVKFRMYDQPICGQCLTTRIDKKQRLSYFFSGAQRSEDIFNYISKFKIYEAIVEINSFQEMRKYKYLIMIPINSKKINKHAIKLLEAQNFVFLVENTLTETGELEINLRYTFNLQHSIQEQEKKFFKKYCITSFNRDLQVKTVTFDKNNMNFLIQKNYRQIHLFQAKNNNRLKCIHMKLNQTTILFPNYTDESVCQITKLKNSLNILTITQNIRDSKQVIDLAHRRIKNEFKQLISGIRIKMNTIVRQIYLDYNRIQDMSFIKWISNLQIVSAKSNLLAKMPELPESISIMDFSSNQIQKIQFNKQINYSKLISINLAENKITKIQNLEKIINLRQLDLRSNKISVIQGLEGLNQLVKLNLSCNPIKRIENVQVLKKLEYFAIGNTEVNFVENLMNLERLGTLVIDSCNISHLEVEIPLPKNIRKLNLSNNKLKSMQPLKTLPHIQQLILRQNFIQTIQPDCWLQNLKLLNLSNNKIQQIPNLKLLKQLKQLYLSFNSISQIKGLEQNLFLSILDISNNKITELKNIKYLLNLQKLYVRNNRISNIEQFQNLKSLKQLELANNLLEQILVLPKSITRINLENNRISSVGWINGLLEKRPSDQESVKIEEINLKANPIPELMIAMIKSVFGFMGTRIIV